MRPLVVLAALAAGGLASGCGDNAEGASREEGERLERRLEKAGATVELDKVGEALPDDGL